VKYAVYSFDKDRLHTKYRVLYTKFGFSFLLHRLSMFLHSW